MTFTTNIYFHPTFKALQKTHLFVLYLLVFILFGAVFYLGQAKDVRLTGNLLSEAGNETFLRQQEEYQPSWRIFQLPETLDFAGEPVPLDLPDIQERFEREIYVNAYWQSNTVLLMKRGGKFLPTIESILAKYGISDYFKYVALIELVLLNDVTPARVSVFRLYWACHAPVTSLYG